MQNHHKNLDSLNPPSGYNVLSAISILPPAVQDKRWSGKLGIKKNKDNKKNKLNRKCKKERKKEKEKSSAESSMMYSDYRGAFLISNRQHYYVMKWSSVGSQSSNEQRKRRQSESQRHCQWYPSRLYIAFSSQIRVWLLLVWSFCEGMAHFHRRWFLPPWATGITYAISEKLNAVFSP